MFNRDDRPLGSLAEDAYERLLDEIDPPEGLPIDDAHERLHEDDFVDGDAAYAIERLLNRGYLYEVCGEVFITDPEDVRE